MAFSTNVTVGGVTRGFTFHNAMSVSSLRNRASEVMMIPNDSIAYVNGENVDEDFCLSDGDEVKFVKTSGKNA